MKGQYLAIESVLTLGMGLAIATGTVTIFSDYRSQVLQTGENKQALTVNSRIQAAINDLKSSNEGFRNVNLPSTIGGSDYRVAFTDEVIITTGDDVYRFDISESGYSFEGTVRGGPVKVFKSENKIELRPG